jgi:hypothetical protein
MEMESPDAGEVCCGKLFYAEFEEGRLVLECYHCGTLWRMGQEGRLVKVNSSGRSRMALDEAVNES